jgi:predicted ribosome-associated RNA-binding protein Tma20
MNLRKKPCLKKKILRKKKLKIGVKLQKNLDKNKFGLDKKKSYCSEKKSIYLVDKKEVKWQRKKGTLPNTIIHLHYNIPHTQHNITKRDVL